MDGGSGAGASRETGAATRSSANGPSSGRCLPPQGGNLIRNRDRGQTVPAGQVLETMQLFAEEVMPGVREGV